MILDRWIDRPWIDWGILMVASIATWIWAGGDMLPPVERGSLFQTLASISIGLLGLGSVTVTLLVTVTPNNRLRIVLDQVGGNLVGLIFNCLITFLISAAAYTALYFFPADSSNQYRNVIFVGGSILLALSSYRLIWLLRRVLLLLT